MRDQRPIQSHNRYKFLNQRERAQSEEVLCSAEVRRGVQRSATASGRKGFLSRTALLLAPLRLKPNHRDGKRGRIGAALGDELVEKYCGLVDAIAQGQHDAVRNEAV